jgi:hypothetical protein
MSTRPMIDVGRMCVSLQPIVEVPDC